jgi:Arc/MetJ-type ribon-helix-helix transcriptional regulator
MREVLSISLQKEVVAAIKKTAKLRKFKSVSSYIKFLFEEDASDLISEEELLRAVKQGRKDYKEGKLHKLNSLKDLM